MSDYPEHDKLTALDGENQTVGDFIEWLGENGYEICRQPVRGNRYEPVIVTTGGWIARYFGIDTQKLNAEKEQILNKLREMNP